MYRNPGLRNPLRMWISKRNWACVACYLNRCWDTELRAKDVENAITDLKAIDTTAAEYSDEDSFRMWMKNRLNLEGHNLPATSRPFSPDTVVGVFHIFFLSIEETPEQLALLRNEIAKPVGKAARSKIHGSNNKIQPIDCVAKRVAPTEELQPCL